MQLCGMSLRRLTDVLNWNPNIIDELTNSLKGVETYSSFENTSLVFKNLLFHPQPPSSTLPHIADQRQCQTVSGAWCGLVGERKHSFMKYIHHKDLDTIYRISSYRAAN